MSEEHSGGSPSRRTYLQSLAALAASTGIAGCNLGTNTSTDASTDTPTDMPTPTAGTPTDTPTPRSGDDTPTTSPTATAGPSIEPELLAHFPFDQQSGSRAPESVSGKAAKISSKPSAKPLWLEDFFDGSLLFEGYTTFGVFRGDALDTNLKELTIDAWIAPRSFGGTGNLETIVERKHRSGSGHQGFAFGVASFGRWSFQVGLGDRWKRLWVARDPLLPVYEWSHLTAVFDGPDGRMELFLNGESIAKESVEPGSEIVAADAPFTLLGRNLRSEKIGRFLVDVFNGAVGNLAIHRGALDAETIKKRHESVLADNGGEMPAATYEDFLVPPERYADDPHRPRFHAIPPSHWMNEPHGPMYYDGKYHLFYQRNPKGPYWHHIHWGHWVSEDMVHWRPVKPALRPEPGIDPNGCWSGDTILDDDGEPVIFYTAVNEYMSPSQAVATARPASLRGESPELADWKKSGEYVMKLPSNEGLRSDTFRDPFVWQDGDEWIAHVSAGFVDGGGTALVFRSDDLKNWEYMGHTYKPDYDKYPQLGAVWELPVLLPVGTDSDGTQKYVFCISPVLGDADVEVWYWIGEWDSDEYSFVPDHEDPQLIDYGDFHFTGPSGFVDPQTDRSILFTIAQDLRYPADQFDSGWAHNAGLPVHLSLGEDGRLRVEPIEELSSLRDEKVVSMQDAGPAAVDEALSDVSGDMLEVKLELEPAGANRYGLDVCRSPDGDVRTRIEYLREAEEITVDRTQAASSSRWINMMESRNELKHRGPVEFDGDTLSLHVYVDHSLIECYVNELKSVTTRAYNDRDDANGLSLVHDSDVTVRSVDVWSLNPIREGPNTW
ncbi:MAG: GH32 C-terminal domain-containing protein [Haloarculaceae archaeon]